jgi:hypothetical protein
LDISPESRKEFVNELRHVSQKILEEEDVRKKIFYYSAAYGIARRLINSQYDPQINFLELILEVSYNTIRARIETILQQQDLTVPIIEGFFDKLAENVNELALKIEKDEDTYKTLEKIAVLTHITTGNGYYLYTKGLIKI